MRILLCIFALISAVSAYLGGGSHNHLHQTQNYPPFTNNGYGGISHNHQQQTQYSPLVTEYEWKYLDYLWDSPAQKNEYVKRGLYDYRNMTPIDVERSMDGRTFVTVIRTGGVPATLHTVSDKQGESGPLLKPYPNWSWYQNLQCHNIINVYRVAIDECNRMWVLDTGSIDDAYPCPAKLLVFNLYNDQLLFKIDIPDNVARNKNGTGLLITPVVETYGYGCRDTTVYMADVTGYGMVIYNGRRLYRLESKEMQAEKQNSDFTIAGESFFLADGLFGMALTPLNYNFNKRFLVFRPLASRSIYAASTEVLKRSTNGYTINYLKGYDVLPSQASSMAFSSEGTLFYGLASEMGIGCWNANKPLEAKNFKVALQDPVRLQFASGLKVIKNPFYPGIVQEYVLVMTNRLQKIYAGTQNFNEINFRITRASVRELIQGTVCDIY